jgi:uncharacterized phage-associated protein
MAKIKMRAGTSPKAETTAQKAAEYLIWLSQEHGDPLTNLKLQKLLYYAQGWFLALHGKRLFRDPLQAWLRGPVVYGVWKDYSDYRWNPITRRAQMPNLSRLAAEHLDEIMQEYGDFSAYTLERMTHREPPWLRAREGYSDEEPSNEVISVEDMMAYFSKLADGARA